MRGSLRLLRAREKSGRRAPICWSGWTRLALLPEPVGTALGDVVAAIVAAAVPPCADGAAR